MHSSQTKACSMASSCGMVIPKRVKYLSESELPYNYSKTPGGTIYSTTPGGTRITYEREQLISLRNSPMSRTPPKNLPYIAGVTKETDYNKKYPTITADINKNNLSSTQIKIEEHPETEFELEL